METLKTAWNAGKTLVNANGFVPKTVQELKTLCASRPDHPSSITLLRATAGFPEEKICYVLPTTLAAIQENRRVIATWEMKETVSPIDGSRCWKKVRSLVLGDPLDKEAGK